MMKKSKYIIGLAGNPNSGKSTIFNNLTGTRVHIGNWPGVTVEKKVGNFRYQDKTVEIIDLPGTYSLTTYSMEEIVTRDFILKDKPDLIIDVVDASNLERNLYLAAQLIELGLKMVLVFNMNDFAKKLGYEFDFKILEQLMGVKIVTTVGNKNLGMDTLKEVLWKMLEGRSRVRKVKIQYNKELEQEIIKLQAILEQDKQFVKEYNSRWLAVRLLEKDKLVNELCFKRSFKQELEVQIESSEQRILGLYDEKPENLITDCRYGFVRGAVQEGVKRVFEQQISWSDKIDKFVLNKVLGIPFFLLLMWGVFQFTFKLGEYPITWLENLFGWFGNMVSVTLPPGLWRGLIVDGVIGGVGGVLVFLPNILLLFLAIAIMEDTGYMARVAFIMDKLMHKIGLHGKSFIPLILGLGCSVPALMATRVLENKKDRLTTMLVTSFMSCQARLPIYVLLTGAFFHKKLAGNVMFSIYILGVLIAMLAAKFLKKFVLKGESMPFVMELPVYRVPALKGILFHMWFRAWMYIKKAGTIILAASVIFWFLGNYPQPTTGFQAPLLENSYIGQAGKLIEPALKPLGFDWKIGVALVSGVVAKEVVVSTLGTLYSIEKGNETTKQLRSALQQDNTFNPLVAYTLMVFIVLYVPCLAAVSVFYKESGSFGWTAFYVFYTTGLAWLVSFVVYRVGNLFI
ncbi:ferrous iron transport protein B [bacterium]|jgi:ferrous iron transport protein B|nr:ferrous iron transport protein B [bacterium]